MVLLSERLHHPRAGYKRILRRAFLWLPSLIAAFALFFFPIATHLSFPSVLGNSANNATRINSLEPFITKDGVGRFGVTPVWAVDNTTARGLR
jgi:hypothetical protein